MSRPLSQQRSELRPKETQWAPPVETELQPDEEQSAEQKPRPVNPGKL